MPPSVSVITPTYNAAGLVRATIDSVFSQTFPDWEMIIVDDHSTDNTFDILTSYVEKDSRIRPILQKQGIKGPAEARNLAIENAQGRFIAFLDSDDLWHPQKLEKQIGFMEAEQEAFTYTRYYKIDQSSKIIGAFEDIPERLTYKDLLKTCPIGCLTAVYDTACFGKVYMPDIPRGQDYGLWLRLLKIHPAARLLPETLAYYRTGQENSVSSKKFRKAASLWRLYRDHEEMSPLMAAFHLARYSVNFLQK